MKWRFLLEKNFLSILTGVTFLVIGVVYLKQARILMENNISQSTVSGISAGTFPCLIAIVIIILSALIIVQALLRHKKDRRETLHIANIGSIAVAIGALIAFLLIWKFSGLFYIPMFLTLFCLLSYYKGFSRLRESLLQILIIDAVFVLCIYLIFEVAMSIHF